MIPALPDECPPALRPILARYVAGDVSGEIALMQCLLALGDQAVPALDRLAEASPPCRELAHLAAANRAGLSRVATLLGGGLADPLPAGDGALAALQARFDAAVEHAPEASVALYSLGSAAILDRAGAEIVGRLGEWGLLGRGRMVLDIGCGIGRIERLLAPEVGAILGIDLSPRMIAEARRRCHGLANADFAVCDGADLAAFATASFDLVLAIDVFPYIVAADPALADRHVADAARLLRPGGALAIFNFSYRGDLAADRRDVMRLAARHGFALRRAGTRDFRLWDGATFLLTR